MIRDIRSGSHRIADMSTSGSSSGWGGGAAGAGLAMMFCIICLKKEGVIG